MRETDKIYFIRVFFGQGKQINGKGFSTIALAEGMPIETCTESIDLSAYGISPARCLDDRRFAKGNPLSLTLGKDKTQRRECGCVTSRDIGMCDTCDKGCLYCYATSIKTKVCKNLALPNPFSPLLNGLLSLQDKIFEVNHC
jgi:hypothetical protein